jgi:uncharacterized protein involved in exopolysaccharide biosynthesis
METLLTAIGLICGTAWRRRRFLIVFVFACAAAAAAVSLALRPIYRASVLIVPNQGSSGLASALGDLSGLAGQFGIAAGGEDPSRLFPDILQSRSLAQAILQSRVTGADSVAGPYLDRLGVKGTDKAEVLEKSTRKFQEERSRVVLNPKNSTVKVVVFDHDPLVAATIANRMASELDRINQEMGRSNAKEKREFIEERRREVLRDLEANEAELTRFREENRSYASSPQLMLEFERINRRVRLAEELSLTLVRELEMARIDEYKDMPVINVLDRALPPAFRHSPRRGLIVLTTGVVAFFAGLVLVLVWDGRKQFWSAFAAVRHDNPGM